MKLHAGVPRSYLRVISVLCLTSVFSLTNLCWINERQAGARKFSPAPAVPVLALASLAGILPNIEENTVATLASLREPEEQQASQPEPNEEPAEPHVASTAAAVASRPEVASPAASASRDADDVRRYLWSVYQRSSTKFDSHGDFTWKDASAAERLGLSLQDYVIGGMDPDFREQLFHLGRAMDAAGIDWTILSAFRDDYRQSLAIGFKAHTGNSFHGGSVATGGYGHGCAVDLASTDGLSNDEVWRWLDQHGEHFGLYRPLRGVDPAHVQPRGLWHALAATLRDERVGSELGDMSFPASADRSSDARVTGEQFGCVRPRVVEEMGPPERLPLHLRPLGVRLIASPIEKNHGRGALKPLSVRVHASPKGVRVLASPKDVRVLASPNEKSNGQAASKSAHLAASATDKGEAKVALKQLSVRLLAPQPDKSQGKAKLRTADGVPVRRANPRRSLPPNVSRHAGAERGLNPARPTNCACNRLHKSS